VAAAFSSVPPFFRYAVMHVARKLWLPIFVSMPAVAARRRIMAWALAWGREVRVSSLVPRPMVRNNGPLRSAAKPD